MSKGFIPVFYNEVTEKAANDELDVLHEVNAVSDALEELGFTVLQYKFPGDPANLLEMLTEKKPLLIFNLVEAVAGNGKLSYLAPSILEALRMKYTGNSAEAIFLTTDKIVTKKLLMSCGIQTPQFISARDENAFAKDDQYIIKPVYEDGSVGLDQDSIVTIESIRHIREKLNAMKEKNGEEYFAEKYIDGREINVSILEINGAPLVLPPTEIKFVGYKEKHIHEIFDYRSKWETQSFEAKHVVSTSAFNDGDKTLYHHLKEISEKCWYEFGLKGYARIDLRVDKDEKPWVLEINANPCITPGESSFLRSAAQGGLEFIDVVKQLISIA